MFDNIYHSYAFYCHKLYLIKSLVVFLQYPKKPTWLIFFSQLTQTETHKVIYDDPKTFFFELKVQALVSYMGHPSLLIQVQRNDPCYNETSAFSSRSSQTKRTGKHEKLHNHTIKLKLHNKNVIEWYNIHSQILLYYINTAQLI